MSINALGDRAMRSAEPKRWSGAARLPAMAVSALFAATLFLLWSGIGPNDATKYIEAALLWVERGPVLGDSHWSLRHPLVAPIAASFMVFGPGEFVSAIPNVLYAAGLVAMTFVFGRKYLGHAGGVAAAVLIATSSFFVGMQSEVTIAGAEVFFIALACWLFVGAIGRPGDLKRFAAAGVCAGGAWLCREVAIFLPAGFALVLLIRRPWPLGALAATIAGFAVVVSAELLAYALAAGDPFYRYEIDFGHNGAQSISDIVAPRSGVIRHLSRPIVYLFSDPVVTPFVILAALTLLAPGFRRSLATGSRRDAAIVFGVCAGAAFLISAYGMNLKSVRYYPLVAYSSLLALGAFLGHLYDAGRTKRAAAAFAGMAALSFAAGDFRLYDEYAESRHLARYIVRSGETITTDHATAARTWMYLMLDGLSRKDAGLRAVSAAQFPGPLCGLVYVATPRGAEPAIKAEPSWREVWTADVRKRRRTHQVLSALGMENSGSPRLTEILRGAGPVTLYSAPPCP